MASQLNAGDEETNHDMTKLLLAGVDETYCTLSGINSHLVYTGCLLNLRCRRIVG
jgi:hypothetical protein